MLKNLAQITKDLIVEIKVRPPRPLYPTGLAKLDEYIWGLHKKELLIVGARPSEGKSAFFLQLAVTIARQGRRVLIMSLEMSKEEIAERLIASACDISGEDLRRGKFDKDKEAERLIGMLNNIDLEVIDEGCFQMGDIVEKVRHHKPEVFFLDYMQMISGKGYPGKLEAYTEFIREFRVLAKEINCAFVIVSQVGRKAVEGADKHPSMEGLKWAGALEEVADTVLLLHWPWKYDPENEFQEKYEIKIAKQRHGKIGLIEIEYCAEKFLFKDKGDDSIYGQGVSW